MSVIQEVSTIHQTQKQSILLFLPTFKIEAHIFPGYERTFYFHHRMRFVLMYLSFTHKTSIPAIAKIDEAYSPIDFFAFPVFLFTYPYCEAVPQALRMFFNSSFFIIPIPLKLLLSTF